MTFACRRCGACCRIPNGIVRVSDAEIARIAAFLGMDEAAFIAHECEVSPDRRGLVLRSRPDGACVWLTDDNRCRLHAVKPDKCRTFPHAWTNPDSHAVCPELGASNSMPQGGRTCIEDQENQSSFVNCVSKIMKTGPVLYAWGLSLCFNSANNYLINDGTIIPVLFFSCSLPMANPPYSKRHKESSDL